MLYIFMYNMFICCYYKKFTHISTHTGGFFEKQKAFTRLEQLSAQLEDSTLYQDQDKYKKVSQEHSGFANQIDQLNHAQEEYDLLNEMYQENPEDTHVLEEIKTLHEKTQKLYISCKFAHELDPLNCFMHIHAGSGGTESQDWARILMDMYMKYCHNSGYECELIDVSYEQGNLVKYATIMISGPVGSFPYGWFKHEHGVHRFVRVSPFDKNARRHTSFVAVSVTPEFDDNIDIDIKPSDLIIKECRASGAGGQHVNKTNSAIQIKHVPTGIVVESQQDRSQHRNRSIAMKLLKSKLYMYEQEKIKAKHAENTMSQDTISWGNQIRSYTTHPYKLIKDLRSKHEEHNVDKVLDGDIYDLLLSNVNLD